MGAGPRLRRAIPGADQGHALYGWSAGQPTIDVDTAAIHGVASRPSGAGPTRRGTPGEADTYLTVRRQPRRGRAINSGCCLRVCGSPGRGVPLAPWGGRPPPPPNPGGSRTRWCPTLGGGAPPHPWGRGHPQARPCTPETGFSREVGCCRQGRAESRGSRRLPRGSRRGRRSSRCSRPSRPACRA
jgi:hypothetical protein